MREERNRCILRSIEQSVQLPAKVHMHRQLQRTNENLNEVYDARYSASGGVFVTVGVEVTLHVG